MGTIFSGVGLISGLDTQAIVDRLIAIEGRPRDLLRTRVSNLGAQKAALLDISARISAMLSRLTSLSQRGSFQTNSAASSDPTVLSATVGDGAPPGAYSFLVRSLATTQQVVSRGFASTTAPLGAGTLTVESARARANTRTRLDELNGYAGVQRGSFELVDASGARKTIAIGDAVTLGDVVERINSAGINVRAAVRGDKLVLTETTGGTLQVREIDDGRTAADLGFGAGHTYSTSGRIEGSDLIRLSNATPLSALNDGNGVRAGRGGGDFSINGMNVDLSGLLMVSTRLERLNHGSGVNLGRIRITTYDADDHAIAHEIDLTGMHSIGEVKNAIEGSGARVSVAVTGEKLIINNTTQTDNKRLVIEDVAGTAARDLGIAGSADARINGGRVLYNDTSADLLAAINYADTSDGTIRASFQGARLVIEAGASATLTRLNDSKALFDLGFEEGAQSGTTESKRLLAGIDSVLLRTLNGGRGVDAGVVSIGMNGQTVLADLDGSESLQDVVDRMNDAIQSAGMAAEVAYDATGTRLVARSLDGVTAVSIADQYGSFAQTFGLNQSAANVRGANVQRRWISENTAL
ncbi:MAG: hypothetical protein HZB38_02070, partial [Planctomycetes bacterium]|nr:hypothetical protein [Planctomycetota bacterium]